MIFLVNPEGNLTWESVEHSLLVRYNFLNGGGYFEFNRIAHWLDFIFANRQGTYTGKQHDVVIGTVADDTIYRVFSLFEAELLTREETLERLKIRKLYNQITFCTEKAIDLLHYVGQLDHLEK